MVYSVVAYGDMCTSIMYSHEPWALLREFVTMLLFGLISITAIFTEKSNNKLITERSFLHIAINLGRNTVTVMYENSGFDLLFFHFPKSYEISRFGKATI